MIWKVTGNILKHEQKRVSTWNHINLHQWFCGKDGGAPFKKLTFWWTVFQARAYACGGNQKNTIYHHLVRLPPPAQGDRLSPTGTGPIHEIRKIIRLRKLPAIQYYLIVHVCIYTCVHDSRLTHLLELDPVLLQLLHLALVLCPLLLQEGQSLGEVSHLVRGRAGRRSGRGKLLGARESECVERKRFRKFELVLLCSCSSWIMYCHFLSSTPTWHQSHSTRSLVWS